MKPTRTWARLGTRDYVHTPCKWNESGFRPPLCTYRLNWARRTSWGWWDDWDDTVLQTQDSKFEPWRSEAEHATSRSRRLPTILTFTRGWGRNNFCFFQTAETGNRAPDSGVKGSGANHYPRAPAPHTMQRDKQVIWGAKTSASTGATRDTNVTVLKIIALPIALAYVIALVCFGIDQTLCLITDTTSRATSFVCFPLKWILNCHFIQLLNLNTGMCYKIRTFLSQFTDQCGWKWERKK